MGNKNIDIRRIGEQKYIFLQDTYLFDQIIPQGFITDGISSPKILSWYVRPHDKGFEAAVVHDYECILSSLNSEDRDSADLNFYYNLLDLEVSKIRASLYYFFVRTYSYYLRVKRKLK